MLTENSGSVRTHVRRATTSARPRSTPLGESEMDELSERQAQILDVISRHIADSGYPPTVREIGLAVGLTSPSTVHAHLSRLEEGGYIKRDPTKPRAMWVSATEGGPAPSPGDVSGDALPIVGSVAAGYPRLAEGERRGVGEHALRWRLHPPRDRRLDDGRGHS